MHHLCCLGCNYVLHSTSQLYSHKRRHERRDVEQLVYKQLRPSSLTKDVVISSSPLLDSQSSGVTALSQSAAPSTVVKRELCGGGTCENAVGPSDSMSGDVVASTDTELMHDGLKVSVKEESLKEKEQSQECFISPELVKLASDLGGKVLRNSLNLPFTFAPFPEENGKSDQDEEASEEAAATKFPSSIFFQPRILPSVNEKKEKDESWKRYLTR